MIIIASTQPLPVSYYQTPRCHCSLTARVRTENLLLVPSSFPNEPFNPLSPRLVLSGGEMDGYWTMNSNPCTRVCTCVCAHVCLYMYVCVHACVHVYTCVHSCAYVCVCVAHSIVQFGDSVTRETQQRDPFCTSPPPHALTLSQSL